MSSDEYDAIVSNRGDVGGPVNQYNSQGDSEKLNQGTNLELNERVEKLRRYEELQAIRERLL